MQENNNPKKTVSKKGGRIITVVIVSVLALLLVFTAAQTFGRMTIRTMADNVKAYFIGLGAGDGYPYSIDALSVKDLRINNSNLHILTDNKTTVLNQTAKEIMPHEHKYQNPAMKIKESKLIVYDLASANYRLQTGSEITYEAEATGKITAAAIGKSGNYALGTYGDSTQSVLTVYNSRHEEIFIWKTKTERITDISLSDNGKFVAVSVIDAADGKINSKLYVFDFKSEDYVSCHEYAGTTIIKVDYIKSNNLLVIGNNLRSYIKNNTERKDDMNFGSNAIYNSCVTPKGRNAIVLSRYASESLSELKVYSNKNKEQFSVSFNKEMKWVDCDEKYTAVLFDNEVRTYSKKGKQVGIINFKGEPVRVAVDGSKTYVLTTSGLYCYDTRGTD